MVQAILGNMPGEPPPVRELIHIQLRTLFRLGPYGQLVAVNEPGGRPAPRVFVSRGDGERLVRIRMDVPERWCRSWLACQDDAELARRVAAQAPVEREHRGPAFALPRGIEAGRASRVLDAGQLHPALASFAPDIPGGVFGVFEDGLAVAVCYSSRSGESADEAGVETAPDFRGRGFATEAVRAWAAWVQSRGKLALYSTTWNNEASRRIAARLGGFEYAENWHLS